MKKLNLFAVYSMLLLLVTFFNSSNAQWVSTGIVTGATFTSLVYSGTNLVAGDAGLKGIYVSADNGNTWTYKGLNNQYVRCLASSGALVLAGTYNAGVFKSTDYGATWAQTAQNYGVVGSIAISGTNVYAGIGNTVFYSVNSGQTWSQSTLVGYAILSLLVYNGTVYAGSDSYGIFTSNNGGSTFTQSSFNNKTVWSFTQMGTNIYAGTTTGVYISSNNGSSWSQSTPTSAYTIYSFANNGSSLFAGTYNDGVYLSLNGGSTWFNKNQGMPVSSVFNALVIANGYVFGAVNANTIKRRLLSEAISVQNISSNVPADYYLGQNYPNPFNPGTVVRFQLADVNNVSLKVYDVQGREVQTIVNEKLQPGTYEARIDGSELPSGTYYYKMEAGNYSETKKMILIK